MLYPATVVVLAFQDRLTLCCTAAAPVPVKVWLTVLLEALLPMDSVAEVDPLACGVKVTVKVRLWPAVRVRGRVNPLILNSEVLALADEIVTLDPEALTVAVELLLDPTVTLPKLKLDGLSESCPGEVPVPDKAIVRLDTAALEVSTRLPLALPLAVGAKFTPKVKLWPALRVSGRLNPLTVKAVPVTLEDEIVKLDPPLFVIVCESSWVLPTCTLPKLRLEGLAEIAAGVAPVPESAMLSDELEALLVMLTLPLAFPAD
jgi:hypothetical protein